MEARPKVWHVMGKSLNEFDPQTDRLSARESELRKKAEATLNSAPIHHSQIDVIFGVGDGFLLEELIRRSPTRLRIIIEKDPHKMLNVCARLDLSEEVRCGRTLLFVGEDLESIRRGLIYFFERFQRQAAYVQAFADAQSLELHAEYYAQVRTLIEESKQFAERFSGDSIEDSFRGLQNTVSNLNDIIHACDFRLMENLSPGGGPVISLAGGPSGDLAWDFLKEAKGRIPIIACDSVLKPCVDYGINPDFVTALERDPVVADLLRGIPVHERTTLVGPPLLLPGALEAFGGRKTFFATAAPFIESLGLNFLPKIFPGSSAGNLNLSLATFLGFDQVIMIGHDLAFGHDIHQTHLRGTVDPDREKGRSLEEVQKLATGGKVPTQDGTSEVYTIFEYNMFRYQIELVMSGWPKVDWINTSAKGAAIKGAKFKSLNQVREDLKDERFDAFKQSRQRLYPPSPGQLHDRRYQVQDTVRELDKSLAKFELEVEQLQKALASSPSEEVLQKAEMLRLQAPEKIQKAVLSILVSDTIPLDRGIEAVKVKFQGSPHLQKFLWEKNQDYFAIVSRWLPQIRSEYLRALEVVKRK